MKTNASFLSKIFPTFLVLLAISTAVNAAVITPNLGAEAIYSAATFTTNGAIFGGGLQSVNSLLQISNAEKLIVGPGDVSVLGITPPSGNFIGNYATALDGQDYSTNPLGILFDTMANSVTLTFGIVDELASLPSNPATTTIEFWGDSGILGSVSEVFALTDDEMWTTSYLTRTLTFNLPFRGIVITTNDAQGLEYQISYNTSTPVPEPAAAWLMATGIGLLGFFARRIKK